jgi:hypothetical protein
MSREILKMNLTFLPVTVTTEHGQTTQGHLVQFASKNGECNIHQASGTAMMHGSPLRGPLFLYQTPDEVDAAIFAFNEERKVPIYFTDPTGNIEHANGQKLAFDWPEKCKGKVELRLTM